MGCVSGAGFIKHSEQDRERVSYAVEGSLDAVKSSSGGFTPRASRARTNVGTSGLPTPSR